MTDPYKTLKVKHTASVEEIRAAYRKLIVKHDPDRNIGNPNSAKKFQEVQAAWDLLSNPERRKRFDETGSTEEISADKEQAQILAMLCDVLNGVLQKFVGQGVNLGHVNLVAEMEKAMNAGRMAVKELLARLKRQKADLDNIVGRFAIKGSGENILQDVVRTHQAGVAKSLQSAEDELARIEKAILHLKQFGYTVDEMQGTGAFMIKPGEFWGLITREKKPSEY